MVIGQPSWNGPRTGRKRVRLACEACRVRKSRCDGSKPPCSGCRDRGTECIYLPWRARASVTKEYIERLEGRNRDLERNLQFYVGVQGSSHNGNQHIDLTGESLSGASTSCPAFPHRSSTASQGDLVQSQPAPRPSAARSNSVSPAVDVLDNDSSRNNEAANTLPDPRSPSGATDDNLEANPPDGWVENDESGNASAEPKDDRGQEEPGSTSHPGYFGESSMSAFMSTVRSNESGNRPSPSVRSCKPSDSRPPVSSLQRLARYTSGPDLNDCLALPQRYVADRLVSAYFTYIDSILPFIHEPSFRMKYEQTWLPLGDDGGSKDSQDLSWLALLNLVFAFGCEYAEDTPQDHSWLSSSRFFKRSTTILFSQVFHSANLQTIQALLLASHYLQGTNNLNKCWSVVGLCIRLAHGMGLHLDPSRWQISHVEQEFRRRLWWGCYVVDCMLSLRYGRPPSDLEKTSDVQLPQPVDGEYLRDNAAESRQPDGQPARCHSFLSDISLSRNIAAIVRELYLDHHPSNAPNIVVNGGDDSCKLRANGRFLSTVVRLDCGLVDWHHNLPAHLRPDANNSDWKLQRQANILYTKYVTTRVMLHRKSFVAFRRNPPEETFQQALFISSAQQCMSNARELISFLESLHKRKMVNMWWTDAQYLYMSTAALLGYRAMERDRQVVISRSDSLDAEDKSIKLGISLLREIGKKSSMIHQYAESLQQLFQDTVIQEKHGAAAASENTYNTNISRGSSQRSRDRDDVSSSEARAVGSGPLCRQSSSAPNRNQGRGPINGGRSYFNGFSNGGVAAGGGGATVDFGAPNSMPDMPLPGDLFFMEGLEDFGDDSLGFPGVENSVVGPQYSTTDFFDGGLGSLNNYGTLRLG